MQQEFHRNHSLFSISHHKEFHPTLFQPSKGYTALNNVITTQISNRAENNMQSRLCRWHTNTHTLHHLHAWHKSKSWFIFHLNPLTWKHEHMTLWAHERFWETERKKPSAHIRSSNFHLISHLRERDSIQQSKWSLWKVGSIVLRHFLYCRKSILPLFKFHSLYITQIQHRQKSGIEMLG